jgi:hypothetical protein
VIDLMGRNRDGEFCFERGEFLIRLFYREVFTLPILFKLFLTHHCITHSSLICNVTYNSLANCQDRFLDVRKAVQDSLEKRQG